MSARSRVPIRVRNQSSNASKSTTPSSRGNSTNPRDRSSPYSPLVRRSDRGRSKLSTSTTKRLDENIAPLNNETNVSTSQSSNNEVQQIILADQVDDGNVGELSQSISFTTVQANDIQSNSAHTTSTNNLTHNVGLNDGQHTTPLVLRDPDLQKNLVMTNDAVYQLFDVTTDGLFQCKLCPQVIFSVYSASVQRKYR